MTGNSFPQLTNANSMEDVFLPPLSRQIKSDFQIVADHLGEAFKQHVQDSHFTIYVTDTSQKGLEPFRDFLEWTRGEEEAGLHPYSWEENKERLLNVKLTNDFSAGSGMAINDHILCLYFDVKHKDFASYITEDQTKLLLRLVAHETHHAWRSHLLWRSIPSPRSSKKGLLPHPPTYLGRMIQEGLAMTFEDEVSGYTPSYPRHEQAERLNEIYDGLAKAHALKPLTPKEHYDFWFGNNEKDYPLHTAYILGKSFIRTYLTENKSPSGEKMTSVDAIALTPQQAYDWWQKAGFIKRKFKIQPQPKATG